MESSPPETARSSGASASRAARPTHSVTTHSGVSGIDVKYTRRSSLDESPPSGSVLDASLSFPSLLGTHAFRSDTLETHGPFGTLWVGLGLCAFYIALVWINTLLGFVLTPLFIVPATWLMDKVTRKAPVRG
jgi:hypothetical protein